MSIQSKKKWLIIPLSKLNKGYIFNIGNIRPDVTSIENEINRVIDDHV